MLNWLYPAARAGLFLLGPEEAHAATIAAMEAGLYPRAPKGDAPELAQDVMGLHFENPIGIAAGFDKDARVPDAILGLGCGFAEVGTITPKPQDGNPKPRVFRLVGDRAMINRLGFNNGGHAAALARLEARKGKAGIVGVNIGANKDAYDRPADYVAGLRTFNHLASYFTANISSPNTPGLRDLQAPTALDELLSRLGAARAELQAQGHPLRPLVVKIAPDIAEADIPAIVERLVAHKVDAIAVSNTTLARSGLRDPNAAEAGGLSGRPLFDRATAMLARVFRETNGAVPLIGIGGIDSPQSALAKIEAGATLLQLYTGLVYEGPGLICAIKARLAEAVRSASGRSLGDIRGRKAQEWARRPLG